MPSFLTAGARLTATALSSVVAVLISLVFSAALTLSTSFATAVSGYLGSLGVKTAFEGIAMERDAARRSLRSAKLENTRLKQRISDNKRVVRRVNQRVFARTLKSTGRSVAAMGVEAIPVWGVAAIVGTTLWEVHDGCETLNDLHELYGAFGVSPEYPDYQARCIAYAEEVDRAGASLAAKYRTSGETASRWSEDAKQAMEALQSESRLIYEDLKRHAGAWFDG